MNYHFQSKNTIIIILKFKKKWLFILFRAKKIRWNIVLTNFVEVLTIIFFVALLYERLLYPNYREFGKQPVELGTLTLNILGSMLPGILMFLCGFYLLLHCWMNAFAELLRFADKMFYKVSKFEFNQFVSILKHTNFLLKFHS